MRSETWDEPVKCAKFIEKFTSHNIRDAESFNLREYSRNDLEGIIQLLHGFYTYFMIDSPDTVREKMKCSVNDVVNGMLLASSIGQNEEGELVLSDELWDIVNKVHSY